MKRRTLSILLAIVMVFSLLPIQSFALANDPDADGDGIVFTKTLIDATDTQPAKIKLEAYVTGTAVTGSQKVPADIVLVLDQSGSMDDTINSQTKLSIMKNAVENFVEQVAAMNDTGDLYRVAVVGFASESGYSDNTEILTLHSTTEEVTYEYTLVTGTLDTSLTYYIRQGWQYSAIEYRSSGNRRGWYTTGNNAQSVNVNNTQVYTREAITTTEKIFGIAYNDLETSDYRDAFINCTNDTIAANGDLYGAIEALDGNGATRTDLGLEIAANIFANQPSGTYAGRSKIVVVITDGVPTTQTNFSNTVANAAVDEALDMKDDGAYIFSMYLGTPSIDSVNFLQAVSSNYPDATSITDRRTQASEKYYSAHTDASAIQEMFTGIANSIVSNSTLNENSIVSDTLTDYFKFAADIQSTGADQIEVYTVDKTESSWASEVPLESAQVEIDDKTVIVKGFDFASNCVTEDPKGGTGSTDYGKKLVVYIPIVADPTSENFGGYLPTNAGAFIYQDENAMNNNQPAATATTVYEDLPLYYVVNPTERAYHVDGTLITDPVDYTINFADIVDEILDEMLPLIPDGTNNAGVDMQFRLIDIGELQYGNNDPNATTDDELVAHLTQTVQAGTDVDVTDPANWTYDGYLATSTDIEITIDANKYFAEKVFVLVATLTNANNPNDTLTVYNYLDLSVVRGDLAHIVYGVIDEGGKTEVPDSAKGSLVGNTYTEAVTAEENSATMTFTPNDGYRIAYIRYLSSTSAPFDTATYIYHIDDTVTTTDIDLDGDDEADTVTINPGDGWSFTAHKVTKGVAVEVGTQQISHTLTTSDDAHSEIISGFDYAHDEQALLNVPFQALSGYSIATVEIDQTTYDLTIDTGRAALTAVYGADALTIVEGVVVGGHIKLDRTQDHEVHVTSTVRSYKLTYNYYTLVNGVYTLYESDTPITVTYGESLLPDNGPTYVAGSEREIDGHNHTLSNWVTIYTPTELSGLIELATATMPAHDLDLHAVWTRNPDVTVATITIDKTVTEAYTSDSVFEFEAVFHEHLAGSAQVEIAAGETDGSATMTLVLTDSLYDSFVAGNGSIYIYESNDQHSSIWLYDNAVYELKYENGAVVLYKGNDKQNDLTAAYENIRIVHEVEVTKTVTNQTDADAEMAKEGDSLLYTITVENTGNVALFDITVTDDFTGSGSIALGTLSDNVTYSGGEFLIESLGVGQFETITYTYEVQAGDAGQTLTNTAIVTIDGEDFDDETETDVELEAFEITKSVNETNPEIGEEITYTITVKNVGNVDAHNIEVLDVFADGEDREISFTDTAEVTYDASTRTFTISTLAVGDTATFSYTYEISEADAGKQLVNTATVGDESDSVTVTVEDPNTTVAIDKTVDKTQVEIGDVVTYTITLENKGNVTVTNVTIADTFDDAAGEIEFTNTSTVSFNAQTGVFTVTSIAPGNEVSFTYTYEVQEEDAGKTLTNTAVVTSDPTTPTDSAEIEVDPPIETVEISKTVDKATAEAGDTLTYVITVTNTGNVELKDIVLEDTLSGASAGISFTSTSNVTYSGGTFTIGTLAIDATETITYTYTVQNEDIGALITNSVISTTNDDTTDDDDETETEILIPGLNLTKTVNKATAKVGDTLVYTITVSNTGETNLENILVTDAMLGMTEFLYGIAPYESVSFTVSYTVSASDEGKTIVNTAIAEGEDISDEDSCQTVIVVNPPAPPTPPTPELNKADHYAYIVGYPDGTVRPEANITRAEVATIFFRMLTDESREIFWATENSFSDVAPNAWYNNAISTLANAGLINGYPDGTFRPDNYITRAEFTKIAAGFFDSIDHTVDNPFVDLESEDWYYDYIIAAYEAGLITGYPEGDFQPDSNISRAEAMAIVNRSLERHPDKDHMLDGMITWEDNTDDKWYYEDVQEATNSHTYILHRIDDVVYEEWTKILEVRDWVALEKEWSEANSSNGPDVID